MNEFKAPRLAALDVLRGLAVAGMIVVTSPGDWNSAYWPLKHAEWNGWTPTDMVFPTFLFGARLAGSILELAVGSCRPGRRATGRP